MSKCTEGVIYKVKMVEGCRLEGGGLRGEKGRILNVLGAKQNRKFHQFFNSKQ